VHDPSTSYGGPALDCRGARWKAIRCKHLEGIGGLGSCQTEERSWTCGGWWVNERWVSSMTTRRVLRNNISYKIATLTLESKNLYLMQHLINIFYKSYNSF